MERQWFDMPQAIPLHSDVAFLCESLACFARFLVHACESVCIEVTLVERDSAVGYDAGDDSGFCDARPDRADAAIAALCDLVDFRAHLCCGEERIAAAVHGRAARVRRLPVERDRMPLDAKRTQHSAKWQIQVQQHGALLDVQLQVGGCILQLPPAVLYP